MRQSNCQYTFLIKRLICKKRQQTPIEDADVKYPFDIRILVILVWLMGAGALQAGNGGYAGAYLRIGLGAPALGMGNVGVASPADGFGTYYNPATMPWLPARTVSLSYSFMSLDRRFNYLGFALPLPPAGGFSAGWIYSGVDNIRAYNSRGEDVGKINHGLHAFYFSFGMKLGGFLNPGARLPYISSDRIAIGVTLKILLENINDAAEFDYTAKGVGLDIGLLVKPTEWLNVGYQIKDIRSALKSNTNNIFERGSTLKNAFPISQRIGVFTRTPLTWLQFGYDFEWSTAGENKHHLGVVLGTPAAYLRAGYDTNRLTFGAGLNLKFFKQHHIQLDYAFVDDVFGEGVSHVFSWQFEL